MFSSNLYARPMPKKWEWNTSDSVQRRILDAALRVFETRGYGASTLNDIVVESQSSVGSIYHHFDGGKDALFTELANGFRVDVAKRMRSADPEVEWTRTYLETAWDNRDLFRLLTSGDSPPTHSANERALAFFIEMGVLHPSGGPLNPVLVGILLNAGTYIAGLDDKAEAGRIITAACGWCRVVEALGVDSYSDEF